MKSKFFSFESSYRKSIFLTIALSALFLVGAVFSQTIADTITKFAVQGGIV